MNYDILSDYIGWIKVCASRFLPPSDSRYDDVVQEGLIGAWMALDTYDQNKGSLPSWVTFKAEGRMKDCISHGMRWTGMPRRKREDPEIILPVERAKCPHDIIPLVLDVRRQIRSLLTPAQKKYVFFRFYCGYDSKGLTEEFGYFPGAVLTQIRKKIGIL